MSETNCIFPWISLTFLSTRGLIAAAKLLTISHSSIKCVTNSKKIALFGAVWLLFCINSCSIFWVTNYTLYCTFLRWVSLQLTTDIILFLPQLDHSLKPLLCSPWAEKIKLGKWNLLSCLLCFFAFIFGRSPIGCFCHRIFIHWSLSYFHPGQNRSISKNENCLLCLFGVN